MSGECSGERTLAACWFPHSAETNFRNQLHHSTLKEKVRFGKIPKPARYKRALPSISGHRAMTPALQLFLILSAALFCLGLLAALSRRHAIFILIGIEMMLAAANINFVAFWRFAPQPHRPPA